MSIVGAFPKWAGGRPADNIGHEGGGSAIFGGGVIWASEAAHEDGGSVARFEDGGIDGESIRADGKCSRVFAFEGDLTGWAVEISGVEDEDRIDGGAGDVGFLRRAREYDVAGFIEGAEGSGNEPGVEIDDGDGIGDVVGDPDFSICSEAC